MLPSHKDTRERWPLSALTDTCWSDSGSTWY